MADISQEIAAFEEASRGEEVRDAMVSLANKLNTVGPATTDWSTITNTPNTLSGYGVDNVPASMVSGVLGVENIPPAALERIVDVVDDAARFALTTDNVQLGDTVRVASTGLMYMVKDTSHLDSESGYQVYTAGTASAVPWSGVQNKPTTRDGYNLTDVYTKTETDNIVDDLENPDEHTVTAGNPITFETESAQMAKATKITFEPIQDLHGYDHPWPAGGGKNLIPMTVDGIKALNTDGAWSGESYTFNGVTYKCNTDNGGNVVSISLSGTSTSVSWLGISGLVLSFLTSGASYVLNGCPSGGAGSTYNIAIGDYPNTERACTDNGSSVSFTVDNYYERKKTWIAIFSGVNTAGLVFYPMIRLESESDATFAPYSNICPISGIDEVKVERTGKNLLKITKPDETVYGITTINSNGVLHISGTCTGSPYSIAIGEFKPYSTKVKLIYGANITAASSNMSRIRLDAYKGGSRVAITNERWCEYSLEHLFDLTELFSGVDYDSIKLRMLISNAVTIDGTFSFMVLDENEDSSVYEPYTESVSSLDLPDTIYSGTLDLEKGELVADMGMAKIGDFSWSTQQSNYGKFVCVDPPSNIKKDTNALVAICDAYKGYSDALKPPYVNGIYVSYAGYFKIYDSRYDLSQINDWATEMADTKIVYLLETPITYQLTPQQLALLKGTNVVSTNASKVRVTYRDGQLALMEDTPRTLQIEEAKTDAKLKQVLGNFAEIEDDTVSKNYVVGSYLVHNGLLRKVTSAIASGESITNLNSTVTTIADELALLWAAINA